MRGVCQLDFEQVQSDNQSGRREFAKSQAEGECESAIECGKVMFGSPFRIKGKTFEKTFALVY